MKRFASCLVVALLALPAVASAAGQEITLETLLKEMVDRDAAARFPDPPYKCMQASSYDRRSKTPDDAAGWFANNDWSQFVRSEENKGRLEWVLMDADGPGAIVRQWWGGKMPPKGSVLRFYLDGAEEPAIEGYPYDILAGGALAPKPLSMEYAKAPAGSPGGMNLYLPIPYAKHCKVTYSEPGATDPRKPPNWRWYNMEYRTYPAGTKVKTFTMEELKALGPQVAQVCEKLDDWRPENIEGKNARVNDYLEPGKEVSVDLRAGPAAVCKLLVNVYAEDCGPSNMAAEGIRSTVIRMSFDGKETVWCPVGHFSGSGAGLNELESWYRTVWGCGFMDSYWVMPYQKSARITFLNLGKQKVRVWATVKIDDWTWDARSMHFHAAWRQERGIPTRPYRDWNYVTVAGKGVYMGDTLAVFNPVSDWWGEGDEKIWVDGESFPSHFGTGTEDYYGYSWGNTTLFNTPFCNQPRCDGPGNAGHTTNTRTRNLDAIPFDKSIKVDMEIWHWKDVKMDYAVTSYWYALPGATSNRPPQPEEAAAPLSKLAERTAFKIPGAIECEKMKVAAKSPAMGIETQQASALPQGQWSGGAQLFLRGKAVGDFVELEFPVSAASPQKVTLYGTQSWDYGVLRFSVNGKAAAKDYDAYAKEAKAWGPVDLGVFEPQDGRMVLRIEVVGANPESRGTKAYFGLDCVVLSPP
ncbi:MAG: DUF2961 domain-containing protein [Planctomycetota bacterium]|nr:DUF2961 domain-containing protein [Planctomycetota bacterium]